MILKREIKSSRRLESSVMTKNPGRDEIDKPSEPFLSIGASIKDTVTGEEYKVTSIAPGAFKGNKKLTKITIGDHVNTIAANAFSGCKKLKTIFTALN